MEKLKDKPDASECQKFLKYAKGQSMNDNRLELYDPRNKDHARDNIKSCMYLGSSCFEGFDETVASMANKNKPCNCNCQVEEESCDIDSVKSVPEGCCDYRKATGKSDRFYISEDYKCPPMPDSEVESLVMPPWFECPSGSSIAPLPAPVGAKIKPISKGGIRTNFERNPNCLCCGAKRKDPFKQKCMKDVNKNCPAMKTRCSSKPRVEKKDNSYFQQIKNMIGIKW
ncbi:unnamed protein product [Allacma fusca]|uniref:Uncharacterized protein n=1 Tax=Allacma fusca TaxID=39272 RepID=A0A8J2PF75_9HEXA|nr:unnamed protein product [Allacma fusca]